MAFLPMTMRHAVSEVETPLVHKHPFDKPMMVLAQEEGVFLLTVDACLVGHPLAVTAHEFVP